MKEITLTNSFHRTSAVIRLRPDGTISRRTVRRVWTELCGMTDCTCSGHGGVRGGTYSLWPRDDDRYEVLVGVLRCVGYRAD